MRHLFCLFFIALIFGQATVRTLWALDYQLEKAVYLKNCENADKPDLHCDGKCYLKKKMGVKTSNDAREPRLPDGFRELKDLQLFCEGGHQPILQLKNEEPSPALPPYTFSIPCGIASRIFHPPAVA